MSLPAILAQASPFAAILQAIVARLVAATGVPQQFIVPVATDNYADPETEPFQVYVRVYGPQPSDGQGHVLQSPGAPRLAGIVLRRIRCYIYTRSAEDVFGADTIALEGTNPNQTYLNFRAPGQFAAEELVLNALNDWPIVAGGRNLCLNVMHWVDSGSGPPERKAESDISMIRSALDFEVEYQEAISPNDPAPGVSSPSGGGVLPPPVVVQRPGVFFPLGW